jgi:Cu/Ag efflux pump CusA
MSLMDRIIRWSIVNRLFVVIAALAVTAYGAVTALRMPVDVFPDLTAPTVTVVTEAHGLAPQEVETLVTFPIESSVNGATGVRRVRSASGIGISIVWVEFDVGHRQVHRAPDRQREAAAGRRQLPPDIAASTLAPISSIMGEILFIAVRSDRHTPMEVREVADWTLRRRLLAIPGVAQVVPIGGEVRQYQVGSIRSGCARSTSPARRHRGAPRVERQLDRRVLRPRRPGGADPGRRPLGGAADIASAVVTVRDGVPVVVGQVAEVELGPAIRRGTGSSDARPAVVIGIQKQPGANTLELTARIDRELDAIQRGLPRA